MKLFNTLALVAILIFTGSFNLQAQTLNPNDIVITEIMYNNPGSDTLEFFEVYNRTASPIDLTGFIIGYAYNNYAGSGPTSTNRDTLPAITLNPGQRVVFATNAAAFNAVFGQNPDYEFQNFGLGNNGGRVYILDTAGTIIDSVHYDDALPWPTQADGSGPSLTLCDENADNDVATSWSAATTLVSGTTNIYAHPWQDCPPGPIVTGVSVISATKLLVSFDVMVDITAENTANYSMKSGIAIASAVRTSTFDKVIVTLATALTQGTPDTIVIQNVQDSANASPMNTAQEFKVVYNGTDGPTVTNVSILSPTSLEVSFDMMVNNTAENTANYSLSSGTAITSAVRNTTTYDKVILTLASSLATYDTLTVQNVQDSLTGTAMSPAESFPLVLNTLNSGIVITEIMFKGKSGTGDTLEFFEIYNNTNNPLSLVGITTVGVTYTFPDTTMPAGAYWVIAKSKSAIMTVFNPSATVLEWNSGALSNGGETIALLNSVGDTIDVVTYNTTGWIPFVQPGHSLVLCDVNSDNNNGANWDTTLNKITYGSTDFYASPGAPNSCTTVSYSSLNSQTITVFPNPVINTLQINTTAPIKSAYIYNLQGQKLIQTNSTTIDMSNLSKGMYIIEIITNDGSHLVKKIIKQ